jgi:hypothetical protein
MTTLDETLLQNLANRRPHNQRRTLEFTHPESGWGVSLTADTIDEIGVRLWEFTLTPSQPQGADTSLVERAGLLARRVTGLLEPLRVIEVDRVAQLRSDVPTRRGEDRFFYEVLQHEDGSTGVRRYRTSAASPRREQVAFTLTHESLAKLVLDLTSRL